MEMPEFYSLYNDPNNLVKHSVLMEIIQKWEAGSYNPPKHGRI